MKIVSFTGLIVLLQLRSPITRGLVCETMARNTKKRELASYIAKQLNDYIPSYQTVFWLKLATWPKYIELYALILHLL